MTHYLTSDYEALRDRCLAAMDKARYITPQEALACGPNCELADETVMRRAELILYAMDWDGFVTMSSDHPPVVVQTAYERPNPYLARLAIAKGQVDDTLLLGLIRQREVALMTWLCGFAVVALLALWVCGRLK